MTMAAERTDLVPAVEHRRTVLEKIRDVLISVACLLASIIMVIVLVFGVRIVAALNDLGTTINEPGISVPGPDDPTIDE